MTLIQIINNIDRFLISKKRIEELHKAQTEIVKSLDRKMHRNPIDNRSSLLHFQRNDFRKHYYNKKRCAPKANC